MSASRPADEQAAVRRALARWGLEEARVVPLGAGLINRTWRVTPAGRPERVLQRVNPIFVAGIHENIRAVTELLAARGVPTPLLVPTLDGAPCIDQGPDPEFGGVYRMLTLIEGVSFDAVQSLAQARAAGAFVGRFHAALDGLEHDFVGIRTGVHDTARHLQALGEALCGPGAATGHRLYPEARRVGDAILAAAADLPSLPPLPPRVCHGDLKFNNLLFAGSRDSDRERVRCLVDLDTVAPLALAYELGDALRSWCNPNGEDDPIARFDLATASAALQGYEEGVGRVLSRAERQALLAGVEWVSVELAARFAADALHERYFGWNKERFAGRGEHNLTRARGQLSLHLAIVATRDERAKQLGIA